jgi:two-component system response regulator AtoC
MNREKIVIIEDDADIRANVLDLLDAEGFEGLSAADGKQGLRIIVEQLPALIICDVAMPGSDGFEVLEILSMKPETAVIPFIFLSARTDRTSVRRGMALGADDYVTKPFERTELLEAIKARLKRRRIVESAIGGSTPAPPPTTPSAGFETGDERLVVSDPAMQALFTQLARIAPAPISVLILGETGVGKEVIAERLHRLSGRKGEFVALNCAALPENLLESELFGHEKGAFTGAIQTKPGLFECADGGTIFLDEVGELPLTMQSKLLRVLEERKVTRLGSRNVRSIDVRFVSATHRNIEEDSEVSGTFRPDLFFRLNGITIQVPALRERPGDIAPLARSFVAMSTRTLKRSSAPELSAAALEVLHAYHWPGNIRELRNVIDRAVLLCEEHAILPAHLPAKLATKVSTRASAPPRADGEEQTDPRARLLHKLEEIEKGRIRGALDQCAGNQTQAAAMLGISRRTLITRLHEYDFPRPRKRGPS